MGAVLMPKHKHKQKKRQAMTEDRPFDTPEIAKLQEAYTVTIPFTWMDTPIYDTFSAIFRYQGGWAFEDWCQTWRPWSDAWEALCDAPYAYGYRSYKDDFIALRKELIRRMIV